MIETLKKWALKKAVEKAGKTLQEGVKKSGEIAKSQLSGFLDKNLKSRKTGEFLQTLQEERGNILKDISRGWFRDGLKNELLEAVSAREMPTMSKIFDLMTGFGLKKGDREFYSGQNRFEFVTALSMFIPDFLLKYFTDPICDQEWFVALVGRYPKVSEKIRSGVRNRDPDAVIEFLRIAHQDAVTVVNGSQKLMKKLPKFTS